MRVVGSADFHGDIGGPQSEFFRDDLREHRADAAANVLNRRHEFRGAVARDADFGAGIGVANAVPDRLRDSQPTFYRTGISARLMPLRPASHLRTNASLFAARRVLVILVAQLQRIDAELLSKFINRVLQPKAALRMSGCAHCGCRPGIREYVILFRVHVRTLVHVLGWPGASCTRANARRTVTHQLHRSKRAVFLRADLQVHSSIWTIAG